MLQLHEARPALERVVKLGEPRVPSPRPHIDNIRARTTNRAPEGTAPTIYDWSTECDQQTLEGEQQ